jgi:hypothetical protein
MHEMSTRMNNPTKSAPVALLMPCGMFGTLSNYPSVEDFRTSHSPTPLGPSNQTHIDGSLAARAWRRFSPACYPLKQRGSKEFTIGEPVREPATPL